MLAQRTTEVQALLTAIIDSSDDAIVRKTLDENRNQGGSGLQNQDRDQNKTRGANKKGGVCRGNM
jgi:hypothetical protein